MEESSPQAAEQVAQLNFAINFIDALSPGTGPLSKEEEDELLHGVGVESIDQLFDLYNAASDQFKSAAEVSTVFIPKGKTQDSTRGEASSSWPPKKDRGEISRVQVTLGLLDHELQSQGDEYSIDIQKGETENYGAPYYKLTIQREGRNRVIFVSDTIGHASYVFDPDKLPEGVAIDVLETMDAQEIAAFVQDHPECGLRVINRGSWAKKIISTVQLDTLNPEIEPLKGSFQDDRTFLSEDGTRWGSATAIKHLYAIDHRTVEGILEAHPEIKPRKAEGKTVYEIDKITKLPEIVDIFARTLDSSDQETLIYNGHEYITLPALERMLSKYIASRINSSLRADEAAATIKVFYIDEKDGKKKHTVATRSDLLEREDIRELIDSYNQARANMSNPVVKNGETFYSLQNGTYGSVYQCARAFEPGATKKELDALVGRLKRIIQNNNLQPIKVVIPPVGVADAYDIGVLQEFLRAKGENFTPLDFGDASHEDAKIG